MKKLDPKFTKEIQDWLGAAPENQDLMQGAHLLLRINGNAALYNTIIRRPERFRDKLIYELKKHLRIRLDGMTLADVAIMEKRVVPSAREIINNPPQPSVISTDNELPKGSIAIGRRQDHDQLPEEVRALYDENFENYTTIKHLFEELKSMNHLQPCDRYDKLQMLAAADSRYRKNLERYDSYVIGQSVLPVKQTVETVRKIGAARKTISKYKKVAETTGDSRLREEALAKIQACVRTIQSCGASFGDGYREELQKLGIKI